MISLVDNIAPVAYASFNNHTNTHCTAFRSISFNSKLSFETAHVVNMLLPSMGVQRNFETNNHFTAIATILYAKLHSISIFSSVFE